MDSRVPKTDIDLFGSLFVHEFLQIVLQGQNVDHLSVFIPQVV